MLKQKQASPSITSIGAAFEKDALVKPFSRKFVRDVEEFADRLGLIGGKDRVVTIGPLGNRCHYHHDDSYLHHHHYHHHLLSSLL